ncbi:MAG: hypothetical protein PUC00_11810 [Clostridiales bacterium]|nr:hypothetical protein [Clostridiales bacterium]
MMYEILYVSDTDIPLYPLLMAALALCTIAAGMLFAPRRGMQPLHMGLYGVLAACLGLLLGRGIHCAVCWYDIFLDELGQLRGIAPFFDPALGSVNIMGVVAGMLLAAPITAALTKQRAASILDAAVVPALALFILARAIEPLSGQGYGDFMGHDVCVCWVEAVLTAVLLGCVPFLRRRSRRAGTLAQYVLTLWCLVQILPESLRCDEALFVLVFARVTHLGLAFTIGIMLIRLLVQGARQGLTARDITVDALALAAGIGLCIATIFALDKTNLPKLLVYAGMLLSIAELGFILCRRIHKEDIR